MVILSGHCLFNWRFDLKRNEKRTAWLGFLLVVETRNWMENGKSMQVVVSSLGPLLNFPWDGNRDTREEMLSKSRIYLEPKLTGNVTANQFEYLNVSQMELFQVVTYLMRIWINIYATREDVEAVGALKDVARSCWMYPDAVVLWYYGHGWHRLCWIDTAPAIRLGSQPLHRILPLSSPPPSPLLPPPPPLPFLDEVLCHSYELRMPLVWRSYETYEIVSTLLSIWQRRSIWDFLISYDNWRGFL